MQKGRPRVALFICPGCAAAEKPEKWQETDRPNPRRVRSLVQIKGAADAQPF